MRNEASSGKQERLRCFSSDRRKQNHHQGAALGLTWIQIEAASKCEHKTLSTSWMNPSSIFAHGLRAGEGVEMSES